MKIIFIPISIIILSGCMQGPTKTHSTVQEKGTYTQQEENFQFNFPEEWSGIDYPNKKHIYLKRDLPLETRTDLTTIDIYYGPEIGSISEHSFTQTKEEKLLIAERPSTRVTYGISQMNFEGLQAAGAGPDEDDYDEIRIAVTISNKPHNINLIYTGLESRSGVLDAVLNSFEFLDEN